MADSVLSKQANPVSDQFQTELFNDACEIIDQAQKSAYRAVNEILIKRNWLLGMRIQHEVLKDHRAEYGEQVIKTLATDLTKKYGSGFTWRNLYNYRDFFEKHPGFFLWNGTESEPTLILHAVSAKSGAANPRCRLLW